MKKKLLGASALVAMVMASAVVSADAGQAPTLSISGNAKFQAYAAQNTRNAAPKSTVPKNITNPAYGYGQGYAFTQNGEMDFVVAGVASNGLEYNYTLILTGDTSATNAIQENRVEFKGNWGTAQFGDKVGPEDILMTDAANVLGATGGFDGDWDKVFNQTSGVFTGDSMAMDTGTATKAIYYTPRFAGFMLGAAFTPSSSHKGNAGVQTNAGSNGYNNHGVASGALNYSTEFSNGFGLSLTAAGMNSSTSKNSANAGSSSPGAGGPKLKKMTAWQLGSLFNYQGWQFGAGYIDNQNSGVVNNPGVRGYNGGQAWSAALGYTFGSNKVAVGYQGSTQKNGPYSGGSGNYKGKADIYSVTADHTLAPGLGIYAEYDYLRMRVPNGALAGISSNQVIDNINNNNGANQTASNKGSVFILGTKISF